MIFVDEIELVKSSDELTTTTITSKTTTDKLISDVVTHELGEISTTEELTSIKTTETSLGITTPLKKNPIFYCNFDSSNITTNQCGGSFYELGSGTSSNSGLSVVLNDLLVVNGSLLTVTDIRSICKIKLMKKIFFLI